MLKSKFKAREYQRNIITYEAVTAIAVNMAIF